MAQAGRVAQSLCHVSIKTYPDVGDWSNRPRATDQVGSLGDWGKIFGTCASVGRARLFNLLGRLFTGRRSDRFSAAHVILLARLAAMAGHSALPARLARFLRRPFMGRAFQVRSPPPFSSDLPLLAPVHRSKSAVFSSHDALLRKILGGRPVSFDASCRRLVAKRRRPRRATNVPVTPRSLSCSSPSFPLKFDNFRRSPAHEPSER